MKNLFLLALLSSGLVACATPNQNPNSIDSNNAYSSGETDSPNVGSKAYSGAEFPAENQLDSKPNN